eukprot:2306481-Karenia_brevis.AAC.1
MQDMGLEGSGGATVCGRRALGQSAGQWLLTSDVDTDTDTDTDIGMWQHHPNISTTLTRHQYHTNEPSKGDKRLPWS